MPWRGQLPVMDSRMAALRASPSEPARRQFFRPTTGHRNLSSAMLLCANLILQRLALNEGLPRDHYLRGDPVPSTT